MRLQRGAAVVEFAIVGGIGLLLFLGLLEVGRALYTWNSSVEAARIGARTASIMAVGDKAAVVGAMGTVLVQLHPAEVKLEYSTDGNTFTVNGGCVRGTCRFVRVTVLRNVYPGVWFLPSVLVNPGFATTMPVEALGAR